MKREEAALRSGGGDLYDALLGQFDRDLKSAQVRAIFDAHKPALIDLVTRIRDRADRVDDTCLHQHFDIDTQRQLGLEIVQAFGYDLERGRLDVTVHPFASFISRYDARITTRFYENFFNMALFGMMHEAGHAMHAQGFAERLDGTPLANGRTGPMSMSVGESQSRSWENMVGRSRAFWTWAYPKAQAAFPAQFDGVSFDTFFGAINKVQPSLIRVEADEVTYNLHIMARFELEIEVINDRLAVADLPEAWNAKYEELLGITPPDDALGVMQDTHWGSGLFGYFPTYALGNLLGAQYHAQALADHPQIPDELERGKFDTLLHWQNAHIHEPGRKFTADELTRRVCGEGMQADSYVAYLREKYAEIYRL
jgi:carboxypeptidase Taq